MKKKLTLVVAFVLVFALGVAGTFAYLTSSDTVTNTFTVGNVQIKLDEAEANPDGTLVAGADRVKANSYKLLPGHTYNKDPMVTVLAGSEPSYVRMLVTVSDIDALKAAFPAEKYPTFYGGENNSVFLLQQLVGGWKSDKWPCFDVTEKEVTVGEGESATTVTTATYEFRYFETVSTVGASEKALEPLFTTVVIPGTIDNDALAELNDVEITVVAQAIQADGFTDAADAWRHF